MFFKTLVRLLGIVPALMLTVALTPGIAPAATVAQEIGGTCYIYDNEIQMMSFYSTYDGCASTAEQLSEQSGDDVTFVWNPIG